MGAKDGHLYELIYQAEEGWFTRKCRKANLTYSPLSNLLPGFLFSAEGNLLLDSSAHPAEPVHSFCFYSRSHLLARF